MASRKTPKGAAPRRRTAAAVTAAERERMVATAAYYRAQRRDFAPGEEVRDWLEAEAEIDALLASRPPKPTARKRLATPANAPEAAKTARPARRRTAT